ncbi:expressed unknown protein [Seminavis robusta]|uniref:Uncharacterized protein n=1 Tax=Seminavis robusta TaxID=568900 RepID=A0A9N8HMB0_9STRA|nr:expressed unknown protein [Seminavis robusta]|eukprot:Sro731_g194300.1 n/a (680) ;mRNA; r:32211-34460
MCKRRLQKELNDFCSKSSVAELATFPPESQETFLATGRLRVDLSTTTRKWAIDIRYREKYPFKSPQVLLVDHPHHPKLGRSGPSPLWDVIPFFANDWHISCGLTQIVENVASWLQQEEGRFASDGAQDIAELPPPRANRERLVQCNQERCHLRTDGTVMVFQNVTAQPLRVICLLNSMEASTQAFCNNEFGFSSASKRHHLVPRGKGEHTLGFALQSGSEASKQAASLLGPPNHERLSAPAFIGHGANWWDHDRVVVNEHCRSVHRAHRSYSCDFRTWNIKKWIQNKRRKMDWWDEIILGPNETIGFGRLPSSASEEIDGCFMGERIVRFQTLKGQPASEDWILTVASDEAHLLGFSEGFGGQPQKGGVRAPFWGITLCQIGQLLVDTGFLPHADYDPPDADALKPDSSKGAATRDICSPLRDDVSVYVFVKEQIIPKTAQKEMGYALLINQQKPLQVEIMVSHSWYEGILEFFFALKTAVVDPHTPLFVCFLSLYQNDNIAHGVTIRQQLGRNAKRGPFVEIFHNFKNNRVLRFAVMDCSVSSEKATCSDPLDERSIRNVIENGVGYKTIDEFVKRFEHQHDKRKGNTLRRESRAFAPLTCTPEQVAREREDAEQLRVAIALLEGLCDQCGMRTHAVSFSETRPITNEAVYDGVCISCHPTFVPEHAWVQWMQWMDFQ